MRVRLRSRRAVVGAGTVGLGVLAWCAAALSQAPAPGDHGGGRGAEQRNMRLVGHHDLQGRPAYQPLPHRQDGRVIAYVGHHAGAARNALTGAVEPNGTSIVDVTDPARPVYRHHLPAHDGERQAQMVQVCDGRALPRADRARTYLLRTNGNRSHEIWDVSEPGRPAMVSTVQGGLASTHKNWWDCATGLAYLVSDGRPSGWRTDRMLQVFDLGDPAAPRLVRNFGLPGQEPGATGPVPPGLHEATALGARLYLAYGTGSHGVLQIVERDRLLAGAPGVGFDAVRPTRAQLEYPQVSRLDMPPFWGGHTAWPVLGIEVPEYRRFRDHRVRDIVVLVSESLAAGCQEAHHPVFLVDVTVEATPFPIATFQVPESSGGFCGRGGRFGAHSVSWSMSPRFYRKLVLVAYFNAGVRVVDIRDPFRPTEVAFFIPVAPPGAAAIQTNNVEVDDRGYVYLADRAGAGLHIVELTGAAREIAEPPPR